MRIVYVIIVPVQHFIGNIMIICICRAVSDTTIRKVVEEHDILGIHELKQCMQVCDQCTCCKDAIEEIIEEAVDKKCCV